MPTTPKVTFVIIGRNEEEHLAACLQSILQVKYPAEQKEIIFVDNDSTDRSVAIAREFPITVIALKQQPATPGRARNAGLRAARGEYVHFVDGDMTVAPEWLYAALPVFADQQVAAVVGRLQEVHPNKSWFNRFFDLGWRAAPLGEIGNPGGGGMFRTTVLRELGGYDDSLFGAEEIDLGYRLRQRNFKTIRIPHIMVWHDMDMKSLGHFWRRGVRDGFYEMEIIARYFTWSLPLPQDYIWKMNAQILALLVLLTVLINHPNIILVQACWALPVFFLVKKARYFYRATGEQKACWLAACFNYLNLFPIAWGELRYLRIKLAAVLKRLFSMPLARARHASTS